MQKIRIIVPSEGFETTATLLETEAPLTCSAIWEKLPIEGRLLHAAMSGNETLMELEGEKMVKIEPENWVYNFIPGDVLYYYSHWGDEKYIRGNAEAAEITFVYGRDVRLKGAALRDTAANLFASIDSRLPEFAAVCRRVRVEGAKRVVVEASS